MTSIFELNTYLHQASVYLLATAAGGEHESTMLEHILQSNVINVVLVALILGFLIKKFNLFGAFETKRSQIAADIESVELQKQEALAQLEEAKRRTANLKLEVDDILRSARESAELLSAQIISDAKTESAKIVEHARKRVELEQRSAIKDLEKRLLSDALQDARAEMAGSLSAKDQKRSVEAFLDDLSQLKGGRRHE